MGCGAEARSSLELAAPGGSPGRRPDARAEWAAGGCRGDRRLRNGGGAELSENENAGRNGEDRERPGTGRGSEAPRRRGVCRPLEARLAVRPFLLRRYCTPLVRD